MIAASRPKLTQISLGTKRRDAQPPFPGGWAVAVFDAIRAFAPAFAEQHVPGTSTRTEVRIRSGTDLNPDIYAALEQQLVALVRTCFPTLGRINRFAAQYVDEYFRLWRVAAESGPTWARIRGFTPAAAGVLGRALWRDLVLRIFYLESCERILSREDFQPAELEALRSPSPAQLVTELVRARRRPGRRSFLEVADEIGVTEKQLYRARRGEVALGFESLRTLQPWKGSSRFVAGLGFLDTLSRRLSLPARSRSDILLLAKIFFPAHRRALESRFTTKDPAMAFDRFARAGENLLLHPGFDALGSDLPTALWRAHLHALQFARMPDLAQAYLRFGTIGSERTLERYFVRAESRGSSLPLSPLPDRL